MMIISYVIAKRKSIMISKLVMSRALAMPGTKDEIVKRILKNLAKNDIALRKTRVSRNDNNSGDRNFVENKTG